MAKSKAAMQFNASPLKASFVPYPIVQIPKGSGWILSLDFLFHLHKSLQMVVQFSIWKFKFRIFSMFSSPKALEIPYGAVAGSFAPHSPSIL